MAKRGDADSIEAWWEELKTSRLAKMAGRFVRGPLREWALVVLRWCRDHPLAAVSIAFVIVLLNLFSSGGAALLRATAPLLGLPLIAFAGYAMWRRAKAMEDQVAASREGLVADRYVKAVAQLGEDKLFIRIGGIYALGQIARKYPETYHETVMAVLGAFVETHDWAAAGADATEQPVDLEAASIVISHCKADWKLAHADEEAGLMPVAELEPEEGSTRPEQSALEED